MNARKNVDYSQMYQVIDDVMTSKLPQMQRYCAIGRIVCTRSEKGAAVMAAEYISAKHPEVQGFSPRNLRRMRDFCRTYENHPVLLSLAMELGWTQNVVIMEADLTMELREWYLRAARQFGWSKTELIARIAEQAHLNIVLPREKSKDGSGENINSCDGASISITFMVYCVDQRIVRQCAYYQCRGSPESRLSKPVAEIGGIGDTGRLAIRLLAFS